MSVLSKTLVDSIEQIASELHENGNGDCREISKLYGEFTASLLYRLLKLVEDDMQTMSDLIMGIE